MGNFIKHLTQKLNLHKFAAAFTAVCIVFMCVPVVVSAAGSATIAFITMNALENTVMSPQTVAVTLTDNAFNAASDGTSATSWFGGSLPDGIIATANKDITYDNIIRITLSGTPTETGTSVFSVTIPGSVLTDSSADITVTPNSGSKIVVHEAVNPVTATIDDIRISGIKDTDLTRADIKITLQGDLINSSMLNIADVSSWFATPLPSGLTASTGGAVGAGSDYFLIYITGRPTVISSAGIGEINIPGSCLVRGGNVTASANASAVFNITETATYSASADPASITFSADTEEYSERGVQYSIITNTGTGQLTNVTYTLPGTSNFVIVDAYPELNLTKTAIPLNAISYIFVRPETGLTAGTYTDTLTINATELSTPITVSLSFTVNAPAAPARSATIGNITISGNVNAVLHRQTATITLSGDTISESYMQDARNHPTGSQGIIADNWIPNRPTGLEAAAIYASTSNTTIYLYFIGAPQATNTGTFTVTIPGHILTGGQSITVTANPNAKFDIGEEITEPTSATISNLTISGSKDSPLIEQTATITLTNTKVIASESNLNCANWFSSLPTGVQARANLTSGSTQIPITFYGTPSVVSTANFGSSGITITIPSDQYLTRILSDTVTANENLRFNIIDELPALGGTVGISLNANTGALTAVTSNITNTSNGLTNLSYSWSVESIGAAGTNSETFAIGDYYGKEITLTVTDSARSGSLTATIKIYNVRISSSGENDLQDSVSITDSYGEVGDDISIAYVLDSTGTANNTLTYSGVTTVPAQVTAATGVDGSGTSTYTIVAADDEFGNASEDGEITIYATFAHTDTAPVKTVSVGTQSGTVEQGNTGTLTYTVTTANISATAYTPTFSPALPTGVTAGSVTITGNSGTLTLSVGTNATAGTTTHTMTIDGTAASATFSLEIAAPTPTESSDATLSNLTISQGTLSPTFSPTTYTYTASVPYSVTNITITATEAENGVAVINGGPSPFSAPLSVGTNTFTVVVASEDGSANQTYTLTVTRVAAPTYTSVTVSPTAPSVQVGSTRQFTAMVNGNNSPEQTVTWDVSGATSQYTTIIAGLLTVGADETATTLTVTATSTVEILISGSTTVTVTQVPPVEPPPEPTPESTSEPIPEQSPQYDAPPPPTPPAPPADLTPETPANEGNGNVLSQVEVEETPEGTAYIAPNGVKSTVIETEDEGVVVEAGINESGAVNAQATAAAVAQAAQIAQENGESSFILQIPDNAKGLSANTIQQLVEAADGLDITLELTAVIDGEVVGGVTLPLTSSTGQILTGLAFETKRTAQTEEYVAEHFNAEVLGSFETAQKGGWGNEPATLSVGLDKLGFEAENGTKLYALIFDPKEKKWYQADVEIIDGNAVIVTTRSGIISIVTEPIEN